MATIVRQPIGEGTHVAWMAICTALFAGCGFSIGATTDAPIDTPPDLPIDQPPALPRVTDGLLGLWRFDEGMGATAADSGVPPAGMQPMNLTILPTIATTWVTGGLRINSQASLTSMTNPHASRQIDTSKEVTIEAWITPADVTQGAGAPDAGGQDFATVFSVAGSIVSRSATIAQVGDHFTGRIRTTTDNNGLPEIASAPGSATTNVTHLVLVESATTRALFVNGVRLMSTPVGTGTLGWDIHDVIRMGDEALYDRQWHGTLWLVALYDRALTDAQVMQNRSAGHDCPSC